MAKRTKPGNPEKYRVQLVELLENFEEHLRHSDLRTQVLELVPATKLLQNLGCSLLQGEEADCARDRILAYMKKYVGVILSGEELMVVAGISEYARRIRELRVQYGWRILTGVTLQNMPPEEFTDLFPPGDFRLKPDQYILLSDQEDTEAAYRWNIANDIRKDGKISVRDKILQYLRRFVGKEISGEELRYVAGNKTEWARRTRELRTELGWPVMTRFTGRPDLSVGIYVLEEDRQAPEHDRKIPESIYRAVLVRDQYACQDCRWKHEQWNRSDPRHLEVHHIKPHVEGGSNTVEGGSNTEENLITLCNICHDKKHEKQGSF